MKRIFLALALLAPAIARAQFIGYYSPQGVVSQPFNAVTVAGPSAVIRNLGQTIHFLNYTVAGSATFIQIRIEGSYDGATFFAISDDATDLTQGQALAIGYYPFLRANLLQCGGCGGGVTLTANYSGVSASPGNVFSGFYNPSQQIRRVVTVGASAGSSATFSGILSPYGSAAGMILFAPSGGSFPANSSFAITGHIGATSIGNIESSVAIKAIATPQGFVIVPTPGTSFDLIYTSGGASATTFTAYYIFYPPGAMYPAGTQLPANFNTETTATNAVASVAVTSPDGLHQRAMIFSVSARCSAGTAGLTITDGATTVWSSGTAEVGTTTFKFQWNPALTSTVAGNTMTVALSTCGAANVGTLDVQASAY